MPTSPAPETGRFTAGLRNHAGEAEVAEDADSADLSGVLGTPTLFVSGERHHGGCGIATLAGAVRGQRPGPDELGQPAPAEILISSAGSGRMPRYVRTVAGVGVSLRAVLVTVRLPVPPFRPAGSCRGVFGRGWRCSRG
jgi:hypothetical protein